MDEPTTETAQDQIDRLAAFIMYEVPGEPSRSEGAVDTAIRLLSRAVELEEAGRPAWLQQHAAVTEERDKFRAHSVILNTVAWRISEALGQVPEGADAVFGDAEADLDELLAQLVALREALRELADAFPYKAHGAVVRARALLVQETPTSPLDAVIHETTRVEQ